ncbi:unnamed protein product [Ixodes pacificus]
MNLVHPEMYSGWCASPFCSCNNSELQNSQSRIWYHPKSTKLKSSKVMNYTGIFQEPSTQRACLIYGSRVVISIFSFNQSSARVSVQALEANPTAPKHRKLVNFI